MDQRSNRDRLVQLHFAPFLTLSLEEDNYRGFSFLFAFRVLLIGECLQEEFRSPRCSLDQ